MKKLSKILESIWSDMQDRGSGDIIKKEDDINLLDGEGFAEYLKKLYKNVDTPFHIIFDVENVITVPVIKYKGQTICVHYDCTNNIVYGRYDFLYYHDPDLFEKLRKEYKTFMLKRSFSTYVKIEPRVGEFSNEFFIEIIDFYLENCNTDLKKILVKNVNESIWSDMQDRGTGDLDKKEDSTINMLDGEDMRKYILNHYTIVYGGSQPQYYKDNNELHIPMVYWKKNEHLSVTNFLVYDYDDNIIHIICDKNAYQPLVTKIMEAFSTSKYDEDSIKIKPKNSGEVNNKFLLTLIDFIIDNIDPMDRKAFAHLRKAERVSESIWSDMEDRGTGDLEKKEDIVGNSNTLKPVDLGGSVYWADKDIEVGDQVLFTFDETIDIIRNIRGWRLPTLKEASELEGHNMYYDPNYVYLDNDRKISFPKDGVGYNMNQQGKPYTLDRGRSFYGWTSSSFSGVHMHVYIIDNNQISFSPDNPTQFDSIVQDKFSRCSIRLVRDK